MWRGERGKIYSNEIVAPEERNYRGHNRPRNSTPVARMNEHTSALHQK